VIQKNQYSSFGKILSIKNKERKEIGIEGATEKSFAYTSREWDEEIDLYYYRARHYDPQIGRFVQKDPIGLAAGDTNLYRYVGNNPKKWVDPFGLAQGLAGIGGTEIDPYLLSYYLGTPAGQAALLNNFGSEDSQFARYAIIGNQLIDMRHASAAYNKTKQLMSEGFPPEVASGATQILGFGVEIDQASGGRVSNIFSNFDFSGRQPSLGKPGSSAFSPEDIPSNAFGAGTAASGQTLRDVCK